MQKFKLETTLTLWDYTLLNEELSIESPVYCIRPKCKAYISQKKLRDSYDGITVQCLRCRARICVTCGEWFRDNIFVYPPPDAKEACEMNIKLKEKAPEILEAEEKLKELAQTTG